MKILLLLAVVWEALALGQQTGRAPEDLLETAAAMIERYRETGDGAYLEKSTRILDPVNTPEARRLKILLASFRHEFPQVELAARDMVEANPRDFAMTALLGDALMEQGKYEQAGAVYQRLATRRVNSEGASRIAWHRFVTGRPADAVLWMKMAVSAGSSTPERQSWLLTELAEMQWKLGQTADAEANVDQALQLAPGSHRAHAVRARILWDSRPADAKAEMERALAIVPLPEYAAELAVRESAKEAERRWAYVEGLEKITAARGEKANRSLAILYADAGRKLEHALQMAEAEYEVRNDVYSHDARAWVLHKLGRSAEAKVWMDKALKFGTPEPAFKRHAEEIRKTLEPSAQPSTAGR